MSSKLAPLAEQFITHGRYLRNWSVRTERTYRQALCQVPETPTKPDLDVWVVSMRQRGLTPGGCNMYIRTVNSYLTWLKEERGHEVPRLKLLPNPSKPLTVFSDIEIRLLLAARPKFFTSLRTWTLICTLLDTGIRIEEALTLGTSDVELDDTTLTVLGKGNKTRKVPFSLELRKNLFRYLVARTKESIGPGYVFCTHNGGRLSYRNTYRDIKNLCKQVGVEGEHIHPHNFRHYFSVNYIRTGGDIYRLSRTLGHTSISTTQLYLRSMGVEMLQEGHRSPLCTSPARGRS